MRSRCGDTRKLHIPWIDQRSAMRRQRQLGQTIHVAILDDHEVVRLGLTQLFADVPDVTVVGAFAHAADLLAFLRTRRCDVALVDFLLNGRGMDGLCLIRHLASRFPDTRVMIVSGYDDAPTVDFSRRAGASGFFSKAQPLSGLLPAVRALAEGHRHVAAGRCSVVGRKPARNMGVESAQGASADITCSPTLSPRERDVLRCCLQGLSVTETAEKFMRSTKTIRNQRLAAFRKLGIHSVCELFDIHRRLRR